ncbi:ABC transporter permease [Bacillus sp. FJAT-52991]|uniref:ABC transporter permease n=1 Tax=Bacillus kandeliae TaxID=3129297 RepID=A0ABZ2NAC8_9BACI
MSSLTIELKKCKRSGVIPIMLAVGVLGGLYALVNFVIRKETLLSLPLPPTVILLTQIYGMIMVLNMFGIIVATCIIYHIEHSGAAMKKMYMLPINVSNIYTSKLVILTVLLLFCIALQNIALAGIGATNLPNGTFELSTLFRFSMYSFITSMPVLSFMLGVSSRCQNMWMTLGIGVAGFFSGMTMAMGEHQLLLINPFVLIMKPAMSATVALDPTVIVMSLIETIIFVTIGQLLLKHVRYE